MRKTQSYAWIESYDQFTRNDQDDWSTSQRKRNFQDFIPKLEVYLQLDFDYDWKYDVLS